MSLRKMSARDGYGPTVSFGVTAHAALPPVVGVVVEVLDEGLVTESVLQPNATADPAAPMMAMASRLVSLFFTCSRLDVLAGPGEFHQKVVGKVWRANQKGVASRLSREFVLH